MKIRRFVEFQHEEEKCISNLNSKLFNSLPLELKQNLHIEANFKKLKSISLFKRFSDNFLKNLTLKSQELTIHQDNILFKV